MPKTFNFPICELPLVIENGVEAGLINGAAEISYSWDGVWGIESVSLEGYRPEPNSKKFTRKLLTLDAGTPIHLMIVHRLENEWRDAVQDAVNSQIEENIASAPDDRADALRRGRAA